MSGWLGRMIAQRFRVIAKLGEGTSSVVWLARHVLLDRLVALKLLRDDRAADPARRARLLREARAASRLHHPNLVEIHDAGEADGIAWVAMDYIPGETLDRVLAQGPLGARRAAHLGECLAGALARGHEMDLVHGRLSPDEVLLVPRRDGLDDVKLLGLGIPIGAGEAQLADLDPAEWPRARPYAAPELLATGAPTPRSDLHALGAVIEAALCGGRRGRATLDLAELSDVVRTLVAADPAHRPRDAFEALDMFRRVRSAIEGPETGAGGASERAASVRRLSFDRIAPLCVGALARIEAALSDTDPSLLEAPRRLTGLVEDLAALAAADARQLVAIEDRGRRVRGDAGQRIDELASERSRTLGWMGTLAERTERLREDRFSGEHPVGAVDALVWEQAALEHEETRGFVLVDELAARIAALQVELDAAHRALEEERALAAARLEGHIAALRALAVEAWFTLENAAAEAGTSLDPDVRRARES